MLMMTRPEYALDTLPYNVGRSLNPVSHYVNLLHARGSVLAKQKLCGEPRWLGTDHMDQGTHVVQGARDFCTHVFCIIVQLKLPKDNVLFRLSNVTHDASVLK
jgi:hypothetical protein